MAALAKGLPVSLNPLDAELSIDLAENNTLATPLSDQGFSLMWSGARATLGVLGGRHYFRVKVLQPLPVPAGLAGPDTGPVHLARVGLSAPHVAVGQLGEAPGSFGYGGTGFVCAGGQETFQEYGESFGCGDEIGVFVDLASGPGTVAFTKNGAWLGVAFTLPPAPLPAPLLPHLLLKNVAARVDFHGIGLINGYEPWAAAAQHPAHAYVARATPLPFQQCEVIMLIGLPGCGKTTWAVQHATASPKKRYMILGTSFVLDQMQVSGLENRGEHKARWEQLAGLAEEVLGRLLERAARLPRNYILDQTNCYDGARKKRLAPFRAAGYRLRAAVWVLPDAELFARQHRQFLEDGKAVPNQVIADMRGAPGADAADEGGGWPAQAAPGA